MIPTVVLTSDDRVYTTKLEENGFSLRVQWLAKDEWLMKTYIPI
jgi:hypothetical protein